MFCILKKKTNFLQPRRSVKCVRVSSTKNVIASAACSRYYGRAHARTHTARHQRGSRRRPQVNPTARAQVPPVRIVVVPAAADPFGRRRPARTGTRAAHKTDSVRYNSSVCYRSCILVVVRPRDSSRRSSKRRYRAIIISSSQVFFFYKYRLNPFGRFRCTISAAYDYYFTGFFFFFIFYFQ